MRGGFSPPASRCQLSRPPAKTGKHAALRKDCRTQPKPGEVDQETVLSPLSRSIGVLPPARFRVLPQTGGSRYPLSRDTVETPSLRALHQESRTQPACPRHGLSSSGTTSHAPDTAAPGNRAATPGARQPIPRRASVPEPLSPAFRESATVALSPKGNQRRALPWTSLDSSSPPHATSPPPLASPALALPTTYLDWRQHISTMTTQDIVHEYGHDHRRHVSVLACTPPAGDA